MFPFGVETIKSAASRILGKPPMCAGAKPSIQKSRAKAWSPQTHASRGVRIAPSQGYQGSMSAWDRMPHTLLASGSETGWVAKIIMILRDSIINRYTMHYSGNRNLQGGASDLQTVFLSPFECVPTQLLAFNNAALFENANGQPTLCFHLQKLRFEQLVLPSRLLSRSWRLRRPR